MFQPGWGPQFLHERVLGECERLDVECLDLTSRYAGEDPRTLWVNRFDRHPSAHAHAIAAEAILERFGPTWRAAAR